MFRLQELITEKLVEGKSYSQMARECNINHVSLSQYHKGVTPKGVNLMLLAKYFRVPYYDLLDEVNQAESADDHKSVDRREDYELRLLVAELEGLSPSEQFELRQRIRKDKEALLLKRVSKA